MLYKPGRHIRMAIRIIGGIALGIDLKVGDEAPDFSAPSTKADPLALADLLKKKRVVLAFFPKAFTGG